MKILIVDENALFREGLVSLIRAKSSFCEVGEASSVAGAVDVAARLCPDLILTPYNLPDGTGLDIIHNTRSQFPGIRFFFLTHYSDSEHLFSALHNGVKGYLLKDVSSKELVDALERVANGEAVVSGCLLDTVLNDYVKKSRHEHPIYTELTRLTTRELDVLCELAKGATNHEIAERLFLSENTVKNHVHSITVKLNLANRREAANYITA
jgi:DNA-binding NarL/FixJ family response regulator